MATREDLDKWERAEEKRSSEEASHTVASSLLMSDEVISRYMNPPANTNYPLEYSYYRLGDPRGKVVLDFGCGNGENTVLLSKRGANVIAMDISPSLIDLAKSRLRINSVRGEVRFVISSAHDIQLPDESVDIVFGMAILHHLDLSLAAKEVHRVLRCGGRAIFMEPVRNSPTIKFIRQLIPYRSPDVSPYERPLTDRELSDFGRGYSRMQTKGFWLPYINLAQILPMFGRIIHPLARFDGMLLRRIPLLNYYASIRVIELIK